MHTWPSSKIRIRGHIPLLLIAGKAKNLNAAVLPLPSFPHLLVFLLVRGHRKRLLAVRATCQTAVRMSSRDIPTLTATGQAMTGETAEMLIDRLVDRDLGHLHLEEGYAASSCSEYTWLNRS